MLAPALTKTDLLEAMRQRHFYASDDWNAEVSFTLNNQPMGSILTGATPATLRVTVSDPDGETGNAITLMQGVPGSGVAAVALATAPSGNTLNIIHPMVANEKVYFYVVVTQADGDRIVTSPIWYTNGTPLATAQATTDPLALTVFPAPTAGTATLFYFLPTAASVSAEVFDAVGPPCGNHHHG